MPKRLWRRARRSFTAPAVRYPPDPRALFVLFMCVVSGLPLVFANATPRSILAQMDDIAIVAWGIMLTGGSLLTLVGMMRQTVNGVIAEQVGSVALGFACVIFAFAIYGYVRWEGAVTMLLVFGLGISCWWRFGQLVAYLNGIERLAQDLKDDPT